MPLYKYALGCDPLLIWGGAFSPRTAQPVSRGLFLQENAQSTSSLSLFTYAAPKQGRIFWKSIAIMTNQVLRNRYIAKSDLLALLARLFPPPETYNIEVSLALGLHTSLSKVNRLGKERKDYWSLTVPRDLTAVGSATKIIRRSSHIFIGRDPIHHQVRNTAKLVSKPRESYSLPKSFKQKQTWTLAQMRYCHSSQVRDTDIIHPLFKASYIWTTSHTRYSNAMHKTKTFSINALYLGKNYESG